MINIDLGFVVGAFSNSDLIHVPNSGGSYNKRGRWEQNETQEIAFCGSLQPLNGKMLKDVPEGSRNEAKFRLDSEREIFVDDVVVDGSNRYRVCHKWPSASKSYSRVALALQEDNNE